MFRKGDRVTYKPNGDKGTVISKRGNVVRVLWDDGFETPVHPLELIHSTVDKENDRSILRQESATANETNTQEKEDFMSKPTENNPPAGFNRVLETNSETAKVGEVR